MDFCGQVSWFTLSESYECVSSDKPTCFVTAIKMKILDKLVNTIHRNCVISSPLLVWPHFLGHATKHLRTFQLVHPVWLQKNKGSMGLVKRHKQATHARSHARENFQHLHGRSWNIFTGFITNWFSMSFAQKMHLLTQTDINNLAIWMQEGKE